MTKRENIDEEAQSTAEPKVCGIVMPISGFQSYTPLHWNEVRAILERAITEAGLRPRPVWESADSDIIHSRIVRNLYNDEIIVCDASGLNPNVMFELGMRLTFKKPTVIVVDSDTKLPFDTSSIEHLQYPADLHFGKIESFMKNVKSKIVSLLESHKQGSYKPYLDTFGEFTIVEPEKKSVKFDDFVVNSLEKMSAQISAIRRDQNFTKHAIEASYSSNSFYPKEHVFTPTENENINRRSFWNDERQYKLKELVQAGFTASAIAESIGEGANPSLVIARAERLGLELQPHQRN